jgi:outer membrane receptor protein involved in Fe transport
MGYFFMSDSNSIRLGFKCALLGGTAISAALMTVSTYAQSPVTIDDDALEEIIVTGTRIARKDIESVSPVTITTAGDIRSTGATRIEDVMNQMPQVEMSDSAMDSNGATGNASIDLRGLGSERTLVLINGRRLQSGGLLSTSPDVNQIPAALVKNVEVLTGGASTVYGPDAVAGVVNFIMDDKFTGFQLSTTASGYQHNNRNSFSQELNERRGFTYPTGNTGIDGKQYSVDVVMGGNLFDEKGHITLFGSYRTVDALTQDARDYSNCALNDTGTACGGSGTTPLANFDIYPVVAGEVDYDTNLYVGLQPDGSLSEDSINIYNYAPLNYYQRPDKRWSMGGFADYEINKHAKPYMEFNFMHDRTAAQAAESGTFYNDEIYIQCQSPLLSDVQWATICGSLFGTTDRATDSNEFAVYVGKRNVEGGPRLSAIEHSSMRVVTGIKGDITDNWKYDAYYQYASVTSSEAYSNDLISTRVIDALDVVIDPDTGKQVCANGSSTCIPYQVFTPGGITSEQAASLGGTGIQTGFLKQSIISGFVSGDLPLTIPSAINPAAVVVGFEQRNEVYQTTSDLLFQEGLLLGQGGATPSVYGAVSIKELYAESVLPLIEDRRFAKNLALEMGLRSTDHSITGGSTTWKFGVNYRPTNELKIRGGFNRAIRSPDARELFEPNSLGLWEGVDNCAGTAPKFTAAECARTGLSTTQYGSANLLSPAGQYNGVYGGNLNVKPEEADTFTLGLVVSPIDRLNISVDYWDIKVNGYIDEASPELVIDACAVTGNSAFCSLINRSASGSLWLGQSGTVSLTKTNLGFKQFRGIDLATDYTLPTSLGTIDMRLAGSYLLKKFTEEVEGLTSSQFECKGKFSSNCYPSPVWRHNAQAMLKSDSFWSAGLRWRYYSGVSNEDSSVTGLNASMGAQSYFDIPALFKIGGNMDISVGVNNVFDKQPPLVATSVDPDNANSFNIYDVLGRYVYASFSAKF